MAILLGLLLLAAGVAIFVVGHAAADDKLPLNHAAGIRLPMTMTSEEAWYACHRASATMMQAAGAVPIFGGVVLLLFRPDNATTSVVAAVFGTLLLVPLGIAVVQGVKAANEVNEKNGAA